MTRLKPASVCILLVSSLAIACAARQAAPAPEPAAPPAQTETAHKTLETPKTPVTDEYHGVKVVDEYRWLEDGKAPDVRAWSDAQNAAARAYLDKLPARDALAAKL